MSDPRDDASPEVPDFDLIRPIGEGGFGRVWLAANRTTRVLRAVKVIPLQGRGDTDPAGREITSLTRLEANLRRQHSNLLGIHHVGKTANHLFYVMDLADDLSGAETSAETDYRPATLQSRLESGPLPAHECLHYAGQLLTGLAYLHAAGMVHRDVKPANCLFVDGQLKLADFGLLTEAGPQVSRVGTQKYMPPDGRMDARADVYAAGLVIYEMLSGLPAESFPRLGDRAKEMADTPILVNLMRLSLRACQCDPQERFQDAQEMAAELEGRRPGRATRRAKLRRRIIAGVAGLGAAVCLLTAVLWAGRHSYVHVNFVTHPFEATVWLDDTLQKDRDGNAYRTPCTIDDVPARVHHVVFKRAGSPDQNAGSIDFADTQQIVVGFSE